MSPARRPAARATFAATMAPSTAKAAPRDVDARGELLRRARVAP